jgi:hypothetical protein
LGLAEFSVGETDIRTTVERHEREIKELRLQLQALRNAHAKEQLEAEIAKRIAELEADIRLQELQEEIAQETAKKHHKRKLFRHS